MSVVYGSVTKLERTGAKGRERKNMKIFFLANVVVIIVQ